MKMHMMQTHFDYFERKMVDILEDVKSSNLNKIKEDLASLQDVV